MIIRANMETGQISKENVPEALSVYGGRGLIAKLLTEEVPPTCDPLGGKNKLVITTGLLAGTLFSGANRLSIGAKSPLTGGIKESNSGGMVAFMMGRIGVRAIILEGIPAQDKWYILKISAQGAQLLDGEPWREQGIYEKAAALRKVFPGHTSFMMIGPAGEQRLPSAGVAITDMEGQPSRFAARGGLGAVLGSKHVLAVIVDANGLKGQGFGPGGAAAVKLAQELNRAIAVHPICGVIYPRYGTASVVDITNAIGGLPTYNFSRGRFKQAASIDATALRTIILERGGQGNPTHACMPGCTVRCSNIYPGRDGQEIVSPLEYETISLLGPNCGFGNLDAIALLNRTCNDLGVDTIEMGAALGVLMDEKVLSFGDLEAAQQLLKQVRTNSVTGKLLGSGVYAVGKSISAKRIPAVKGQAMAGYEPRAIKGLGVTYATSPMGADHTAGNNIRQAITHSSKEGQVENSRIAQTNAALWDNIGMCSFVVGVMAGDRKVFWADAVSACLDQKVSLEQLQDIAGEILELERQFNSAAGLTVNKLPDWCYDEVNPDSNSVFDFTDNELAALLH